MAQNPNNVNYKNKVSKYGTLMVRAVQGGGNGNGNGEVDELLRKIDGVVRKSNINGGGKQVTGYRNMRGGTPEESAQIISRLHNIITEQANESSQLRDRLVSTITTLTKSYANKKEEYESQLKITQTQQDQLNAALHQLAALQQQQQLDNEQQMNEQHGATQQYYQELETLHEQLQQQIAALSENETLLKQKLEELQNQINKLEGDSEKWNTQVFKNLQDTEIQLNQQVAAYKVAAATADTSVGKTIQAADEATRAAYGMSNGGSRRTTRRH